MAIRTIINYPERILQRKARDVVDIDGNIGVLVNDMLETMYDAPGIGLAAPQVGVGLRVAVVDCSSRGEQSDARVMINPIILESSDETETDSEGCLSLPGINADIERSREIVVTYRDPKGEVKEERFGGLWARCVQHEIDHLDGRFFVDHLSRLKRHVLLRRFMREQHGGKIRARS